MSNTRFHISETDQCPKCGAWCPMPFTHYEEGLFTDRIRVACGGCGYSVTRPCLDHPDQLVTRLDRIIERVKAGAA